MINKYFIIVDNETDAVLGVKKYRGITDIDPERCFTIERGTRLVSVPDREYFKMACFDDFVDPTIKPDLELQNKSVAKWNIIRQEIEFVPCLCVGFSATHTEPPPFHSVVFDNKDIRTIPLSTNTPHILSLCVREIETGYPDALHISTTAELVVMEGTGDTTKPPTKHTIEIVNGRGTFTFPIPAIPTVYFVRISHPQFLLSPAIFCVGYK